MYLARHQCIRCVFLFYFAALTGLPGTLLAQAKRESSSPAVVDSEPIPGALTDPAALKESIESQKKRVGESTDLAEEQKKTVLDMLDKALDELRQAQELVTAREQFEQRRLAIPANLAGVKEWLQQLASPAPVTEPESKSLSELEQELKQAQTSLEEEQKTAADLEGEPKRRADRLTRIPEESAKAKEQIQQIKQGLAALPADAGEAAQQARRSLLLAQLYHYQQTLDAITQEQQFYVNAGELLTARRELRVKLVDAKRQQVAALQKEVNDRRLADARNLAEKVSVARVDAEAAPPVVQEVLDRNKELAEKQKTLVTEIERTVTQTNQLKGKVEQVAEAFRNLQEMVESTEGITGVIGVLLMSRRYELPNATNDQQAVKQRFEIISQARLAYLRHDQDWSRLNDIDAAVEERLRQHSQTSQASLDEFRFQEIREELRTHLQTQREILGSLKEYALEYASGLAKLDNLQRNYIETVDKYRYYIEENVLWTRSSVIGASDDVAVAWEALQKLVYGPNWLSLGRIYGDDVLQNLEVYIPFALVFIVLMVFHRKCHRDIRAVAEKTRHHYSDRFLYTLQVLVLTVALSAIWPALPAFLYWRFTNFAQTSAMQQAITGCLPFLAVILFLFGFVKYFCLPGGLGPDHFKIDEAMLRFVKRHVNWLMILLLPLIFVHKTMELQTVNVGWNDTLGRLALMGSFAAWMLFVGRLLRPGGRLVSGWLDHHRGGWLDRLRYVWYLGILGIPLILLIVAAGGYYYGAQFIYEKLLITLFFVLAVILVRALLMRWLQLAHAKLVLQEKRRQYMEARRAEEEKAQSEKAVSESVGIKAPAAKTSEVTDVELPDIEEVMVGLSNQTQHLIKAVTTLSIFVGVWLIWKAFLPAMNAMNEWVLWSTTDAQGNSVDVSVSHLILATVILILLVVLARNIPGLMEIVVLQRLPLDAGARFAITMVTRYVIIAVGIVMIFSQLGVGWSKVQWLVAAVSVGLGFGLQEIFANFVSGLLILFDQPIRVGDIITVDNITGTVTKISIRATTITDWDRKEYVVPNKEFITGRVLNWTLSNKVSRFVINVGIAYGSDVRLALDTLERLANEHPLILDDPAPIVTFEGFGDSTLNLVMRCYLPDLDNRLKTVSEMHEVIDREFRKAGIEIAFPQRDIHIRTVREVPIHMKAMDQPGTAAP